MAPAAFAFTFKGNTDDPMKEAGNRVELNDSSASLAVQPSHIIEVVNQI